MEIIGLIAEYSPFHNGHLYQLKTIKKIYPNSIIILVLNGYFLQRGIPSIQSKEEKTRLSLKYGVDLVLELPYIFSSNSADYFSKYSLKILNELKINKLIFGSESNDINLLKKVASKQLEQNFDDLVKYHLNQGLNYPTALNKAIGINLNKPNDLLAVSYIKEIIKNNYNIEPICIKRTSDYHDIESNNNIISATNIRNKIKNNENIDKYIPEGNINIINNDKYFELLKYKILTDNNLSVYLGVDEGLESRIKKYINKANNLEELINYVKSKRYTYNRLMRMFNHILTGLTKDMMNNANLSYIRILGFNSIGKDYLNSIKKEINLPITSNINKINSIVKDYEYKCANIYNIISNDNVLNFEYENKPLFYK